MSRPLDRLCQGFAMLAAACTAGCFSPDYGVGGDQGSLCVSVPRSCPAGYVCVPKTAEVNQCWREDKEPPASITVALDRSTVQFQPADPKDVLQVTVTLSNFAIDKDMVGSRELEPHFGHFHIFLDDLSNFSPSAANYVSGKETTVQLTVSPDLPPFRGARPGPHTLFVSLANHNHTELSPPTRADATFTILP